MEVCWRREWEDGVLDIEVFEVGKGGDELPDESGIGVECWSAIADFK